MDLTVDKHATSSVPLPSEAHWLLAGCQVEHRRNSAAIYPDDRRLLLLNYDNLSKRMSGEERRIFAARRALKEPPTRNTRLIARHVFD